MLTLSVIVVNWNVGDLLRECLESLYRNTSLPEEDWELIVVDNQSTDGAPEMIRREFPRARLVANDYNAGFAKANNQAFALARGRYLLLLNPDTIVLDGAVDRLLELIEGRPDAGAAGCRLLNTDGTTQQFTGGYAAGILNVASYYLFAQRLLPPQLLPPPLFLEKQPEGDIDVGWVSGCCMLLRREALQDRLFDEKFFLYGEDLELCQRILASGWKIVYSPGIRIVHYGGGSRSRQTPEMRVRNLRGLREVYLSRRGLKLPWLFDLVMAIAFLIRVGVFGVGSLLKRGKGLEERVEENVLLLSTSVRYLLGGSTTSTGR
ncbi:MAG: glycosyltransferase family 2 protein [Bryobacteraceae bacterium]|nr:glycosyltransferase family 2 protein [Bryobacteraceae bacterium]